MKFSALALLLPFGLAFGARAETPSDIPNPLRNARSFVADNAEVVAPEQETRLNNLLVALERKTGDEFAVVTVRNLSGQDIESFANELARRWKIGKQGRDNGLLLLVAIQDRKSRFEVGYGLEESLNDAKITAILRSEIRPAFQKGDYAGGLIGASQAVVDILSPGLKAAPASGATAPVRQPNRIPAQPFPNGGFPAGGSPYYPPPPRFSGPVVPGGGAFLMFLMLGGGFALLVALTATRPRKCRKCNSVCQPLDQIEESKRLKEGEVWEERLGARDYTIWKCTKCAREELEVKDRFFTAFFPCQRCGFKTCSASTQTLQYPTYFAEGLERVTVRCAFPKCGETTTHTRAIPRVPPPVRRRYGGGFGTGFGIGVGTGLMTGGWGHSNDSNDSGSFGGGFGGGDSGPADFGGGDFGGGGGSSDW